MNPGIAYALLGAVLFGASTPIAKLLVGEIGPVMLAGLLYAGSGVGLGLWLAARGLIWPAAERPRFAPGDYKWLAGAVISGGVIGPALLMLALAASSASSVSLLLNLESVFTALLAWFVFRENFDRRLMLGMSLIVCGGVILGWRPGEIATFWPALAVAGACLCWARPSSGRAPRSPNSSSEKSGRSCLPAFSMRAREWGSAFGLPCAACFGGRPSGPDSRQVTTSGSPAPSFQEALSAPRF